MGRRSNGEYVILDVVRFRGSPGETDRRIQETAHVDGRRVEVWIQEEPGSASKLLTFHYQKLLEGHIVKAHRVGRTDGDKFERAKPFASAAEHGLVQYLPGSWIHEWLREHGGFPNRAHDDQVDSAAGAHYILSTRQVGKKNHTRVPGAPIQVARTAYGT
jgi:predicted phage terminase large subunit-like protein